MRLDKGFDQDEIWINISSAKLLMISLIVIAGIILIQEIPDLFNQVFVLMREIKEANGGSASTYSFLISSSVKVLVALLMIGERKRIISFIEERPLMDDSV